MSRLLLVKSLVLVLLSLVVLSGCGGSGGVDSEHDLVPTQETHVTDTNTTPDTNGTQPDDSNGTTGGGSDDGNTTGDGNDTNTTVRLSALKLTPGATTLPKDHNTTVILTATYSDHTTKPLTSGITWIITPKDAATIKGDVLTARKDINVTVQAKVGTTLSNTVNLNIYWEVNGHRLPPEPDPAVNDATLLGVDVNKNGIRDDVERLIIIEEAKNKEFPKTQTAISLQYAWAWQKMIGEPTLKSRKYLENASACQWYFFDKSLKNIRGYKKRRAWRKKHVGRLGVKLEDAVFNTKERILRRFEFNRACSGNIFQNREVELSACMFNIDNLGE